MIIGILDRKYTQLFYSSDINVIGKRYSLSSAWVIDHLLYILKKNWSLNVIPIKHPLLYRVHHVNVIVEKKYFSPH